MVSPPEYLGGWPAADSDDVLRDSQGTSVTTTYNFFESSAIGDSGLVNVQVTALTGDRNEDWKEYLLTLKVIARGMGFAP